MKNKLFIFFSLAMLMMVIIACHSPRKLQVYRFMPSVDCDSCSFLEFMDKLTEIDSDPKSIALINDSILEYSKRYGGLYSLTAINYKIINNVLIVDSVNINGYDVPNITNMRFLYTQDSLINTKNNEKYYNEKYYHKKHLKWGAKE